MCTLRNFACVMTAALLVTLCGCHPYVGPEPTTSTADELRETPTAKPEAKAVEKATEQSTVEPVSVVARLKEEAKAETDLKGPNLEGKWKLLLPKGFEKEATIERLADGEYRITTVENLSGEYELLNKKLKMRNPGEHAKQIYVWTVENPNKLQFTEAPPVALVGSDYRGATLTRSPDVAQPDDSAARKTP